MKSKIKIAIEVEVVIVKQDDYYVAYCPALDLSAYGDSLDKAAMAFNEELDIFVEETAKRGTLNEYLLQKGWKLQRFPKPNYEPPRVDSGKLFDLAKSKSKLIRQQVVFPVC